MLIELGKEYPNIYHIDVRGFTHFLEIQNQEPPDAYWYDELHPTNIVFKEISKTYLSVINNEIPNNKRVFSVIQFYKENNKTK